MMHLLFKLTVNKMVTFCSKLIFISQTQIITLLALLMPHLDHKLQMLLAKKSK
jgi:hypothetical protein